MGRCVTLWVNEDMSGFLGRYDFQLDAKGRVSLPAALRRGMDGGPLILVQWQQTHLDLFPAEAWETVQRNLMEFRKAQPDGWAYFRRITSSAVEVVPDKQHRILVPSALQEGAGLEGPVALIGALDRIELWNPDRFKRSLEVGTSDFEQFAPRIFGG